MGIPQIPLITVQPSAPHTHTVVFLHGRGDRVHNFEASLHHSMRFGHKNYAEAMPSVRWVFPQAPMRKCASLPDTWPQWFDVWDVRNFADNEELQAEGLKEVVPEIRKILAREAARLGGRWDRLVIAGISMGGATSVHTLFNLNVPEEGGGRLGAFIGFSCRCPFVGRTLGQMREVLGLDDVPDNNEVLRKTPILLEHCADDPLVLVQNGRAMRDALRGFGATVEWKEYPTGGHWFQSPDGGADMMDFLRRVLEQNVPTQASSSAMDLS